MTRSTAVAIITMLFLPVVNAQNEQWGKLANPGYIDQPIKSAYFFTGNWRNGVQFYDYNPSNNTGLYTVHPADSRHLGWSENVAFRDFAIQAMVDAGVNVVNMSYWGLPGSDNWAFWSPMQTSTTSHDELFDATLGKNILIAPYIESFAPTDAFSGFSFVDDFPGSASQPAPVLSSLIEDLVDRYLLNPANAKWPSKWAKVYDQNGQERYLISIIHVASNQALVTDQIFADGFDRVADAVWNKTGIRIGFALDILPGNSFAPGIFKATPTNTGPRLAQQLSVIATQCFIPEIWTGMNDEHDLTTWKKAYQNSWINTGIPFVHDISSGYDAHIVFPSSPQYGNNDLWRNLQSQAIQDFGSQSFTINTWNGYTEGFTGVPTLQYGDVTYSWICALLGGNCGNSTYHIPVQSDQLVEVFPNPVSDYLSIQLKDPGGHLISTKIADINGRTIKLWQEDLSNNLIMPTELKTGNIPDGIYFLFIQTEKSSYVKKIVKAK